MQFLTTIALTLALAFSPSAIAAPNAIANTDLLPRDISSMPNGMKSLLTRDATADSMTLEKRATCVSACLSGCGFCGSQGCLANCQINWYVELESFADQRLFPFLKWKQG